jgi:epoxyqueuosine reductase
VTATTPLIKEKAHEMGFDLIGVAPAARAVHADACASWVEAGYAAGMGYMTRDMPRRQDVRLVLPDARSVIVVGVSYFTVNPPTEFWDDPARGRIARYAWGMDYHDAMLPRLRHLADFIRMLSGRDVQCRTYVDTGPVLERDWAAQAGLGFIGKNTCLISPAFGSYLFLAEVLVDLEMEYDPLAKTGDFREPARAQAGTCGTCTRCMVACPTQALVAPYILDSRRCISYLTIEHKGPIPLDIRPHMGRWVFGCDECQSVCPWPRRFAHAGRQDFLAFDAERCAPRLLDLIGLDEHQFRARFKGSPLLRARRHGLLRNAAIALANWGDERAIPALKTATQDAHPLVREHAAWALGQILG